MTLGRPPPYLPGSFLPTAWLALEDQVAQLRCLLLSETLLKTPDPG